MHRRTLTSSALAAGIGAAALAAASTTALAAAGRHATPATAGGPKITVRIEGGTKTLLPATTIRVPSAGSITKDGAPSGACPAASATGALQVATKGNWSGTYSTQYGDYEITKILGDLAPATATTPYWEILVNDVASPEGACATKLRAGDRLLFAVVGPKDTGLPLVIKTASRAKANSTLKVTVDEVNAKGKDVALKGAKVTGGAKPATTNAAGIATVAVGHPKTLKLGASDTGYIRAASVTLKVAS